MTLEDASRVLIVLAVCDWVFTAMIYLAARRYRNAALIERATASIILSTVATIVAMLSLAYLLHVPIGVDLVNVTLVGALILVSAPQFIWAFGLASGKFR